MTREIEESRKRVHDIERNFTIFWYVKRVLQLLTSLVLGEMFGERERERK